MAVEVKEEDGGKAQIEVSQEPKVSEIVKEYEVVIQDKDGGKVGEGNGEENMEKVLNDMVSDGDDKENGMSASPKVSEIVKEYEVVIKEKDGKIGEGNGEENNVNEMISDGDEMENAAKSEKGECSSSPNKKSGESSPMREENVLLSDLKTYEKKALMEMRSKLEEAILMNKLYKKEKKQESHIEKSEKKEESQKDEKEKEQEKSTEDGGNIVVDKGKAKVEEEEEITESNEVREFEVEIDKDIALWGVPLLPSKGDKGTDVLLCKFLRAREFRADEAFKMLKNTLQWRKENRIDSILDEDFGNEYDSVGYMKGLDREGHPICYNVYGVFADEGMYNKTFGNEATREKFLRWRLQLLEREIRNLDFAPGGVSTLLQINDLRNTPGPSRRDLRLATRRAVEILQDNYPEFVARNIFINVPFWYYAFNALLSPFLTQRTKSKFVFSRPARVTETLLKYVAAEEIPVLYGGLRREKDPDFSTQDAAFEVSVKAGATETVEIPAPEVGNTLMWDMTVIEWDVNYKEEFVPTDEGSYTVIVKKGRKISWQQEPIRNSFVNKEPGKVVITIENGIFKKKKVLYRYKTKSQSELI